MNNFTILGKATLINRKVELTSVSFMTNKGIVIDNDYNIIAPVNEVYNDLKEMYFKKVLISGIWYNLINFKNRFNIIDIEKTQQIEKTSVKVYDKGIKKVMVNFTIISNGLSDYKRGFLNSEKEYLVKDIFKFKQLKDIENYRITTNNIECYLNNAPCLVIYSIEYKVVYGVIYLIVHINDITLI